MGDGVKTAIAAIGTGTPGERWEQLGMLPPELPAAEGAAGDAGPRGRGRPPGSKNQRTKDWADYLLANYQSPLIGLAKIAASSPAEFVEALRADAKRVGLPLLGPEGTLLDVVKLQITAMRELAPFIHEKMPVAVNVRSTRMTIILEASAEDLAGASFDALGEAVTIALRKDEENQGDSEQ